MSSAKFVIVMLYLASSCAIYVLSDRAGIYVPDKPQGVVLDDGYQVIYPGPVDLGAVMSNSFNQIVQGIGTAIHAAVDYVTRFLG